MRAFTLFNDNTDTGISVLAEVPSTLAWNKLDEQMEDMVGDLKTIPAIVNTIKEFPKKFTGVKFISCIVYEGISNGTVQNNPGTANAWGIQETGYVIKQPSKTHKVEFA